ncbi:maltose ABC transporter substrate-binding protein [Clostridium sp. YIM B02505]|uniref:Maltodextrin-binding protein n=1 Tax=Clostridium yunnanense TaxID=2800325 RepID=A0ABS1EQR7_9CLOT|nr:maltose ABC transporter substrate-binding protein [Clostridium yunnanense]MBK1811747.1 maltose ABC transporter substrate-binding protein [Clostridium yunnanense]
MRSKKFITMLITAAVTMSIFAGCGKSNTTTGKKETKNEQVTIRIWHPYANAEETEFKKIVKDFETKHPNIKTEVLAIPFDQLADKSKLAFSSHDAPDVLFGVHDGIGNYAEMGALEPMDQYVDDMSSRFMDSAVEATKYKGASLAAPISVEGPVLIYNKDLVKTPPKSLDELVSVAKQNTKDGKYGLVFEYTNFYYAYGLLTAFGGDVFKDRNNEAAKPNLNTPEAVKTLDFIRKIKNEDKIVPAQIDYQTEMALFTEGKAAFMLNGPWCFGDLEAANSKVKGNWGVASLPDGAKQASPYMGVKVVYIPKDAKHKDEAGEFIKYVTSTEVMTELNKTVGWVPANKNVDVSADFKAKGVQEQAKKAYAIPSIPEMGKVWDPMKDALTKAVTTNDDTKKIMDDVQAKVQKEIQTLHGN